MYSKSTQVLKTSPLLSLFCKDQGLCFAIVNAINGRVSVCVALTSRPTQYIGHFRDSRWWRKLREQNAEI